jgi:hypothetical protein
MDYKLSILIPVHERHISNLSELLQNIYAQIGPFTNEIEILHFVNKGEKSIGEYRQMLLSKAVGEYVVFIDADDRISIEYISSIITAIASHPDCVGLKGTMTTNGRKQETWEISKDLPYDQIRKSRGLYHYRRYSNHLAPIKRDIALQIGYKSLKFGEDFDYATRLSKSGLCKTEVKIDRYIYHYDFWTKK